MLGTSINLTKKWSKIKSKNGKNLKTEMIEGPGRKPIFIFIGSYHSSQPARLAAQVRLLVWNLEQAQRQAQIPLRLLEQLLQLHLDHFL